MSLQFIPIPHKEVYFQKRGPSFHIALKNSFSSISRPEKTWQTYSNLGFISSPRFQRASKNLNRTLNVLLLLVHLLRNSKRLFKRLAG